jgi:hypothetical protein
MSKTTYTKAERQAEKELDAFLQSVNSPSAFDIMSQLRGYSD